MNDWDEGKDRFLGMVKAADPAVQTVVPVSPSNGVFLISLTKGPNRKFITLSEDDVIDLPNEADIQAKVGKILQDAIAAL